MASTPGRQVCCLVPAAVAAGLMACSGGSQGPQYSGPPYATAVSASGALNFAVRLSQQPPAAGLLEAQLTVTSTSDNTPVDGLALQVLPWMPLMKHGTSVTPAVAPEGDGKYLVSDLDLFMPGLWALQMTLSGASADSVAPQFQVQ